MKRFNETDLTAIAEYDHKGTVHIEFSYDCFIQPGIVHIGVMPKELWDQLPDIDAASELPKG